MQTNTSLTLSVPNTNIESIISIDDALLQCHAERGAEDSWFEARIKAGIELVEDYIKQSITDKTWILRVEGDFSTVITLPRSPVKELLSVKYQDNVRDNLVDINIDNVILVKDNMPAHLILPDGFNRGVVIIEYMAGYNIDKVPSPIKDAILLYVSYNYESRAGEREFPFKTFYNLIEKYRLYDV